MKHCLITGASRGIGLAIARQLAGPDYCLWLQGRDSKALNKTAQEISIKGGESKIVVVDLTKNKDLDHLFSELGQQELFAFINNAGCALVKPFDQVTNEEWRQTMALNVTAPFLISQKCLPLMKEGAAIINILSIAAKTGFPNWSAYCASKFALEGFSQSLREELRPKGIRVINVYPGATDTELWNDIPGEWPRKNMLSPENIAQTVSFALKQPPSVSVDHISLGNVAGTL